MLRRHRLTCPRQPAFAAGHQARYPAGYTRNDLAEGPGHHVPRFPASFRPPAFASWASCSRQGVEPSSRSAYHHQRWRTRTGLPRSPRMRYSRVGCPLDPGGDGVHTVIDESLTAVCRLSAASPFVSPVLTFGLPLTCSPRTVREPLGFSLSFAPGNYSPRTSGRGPISDTDRELRLGHLHPTSNRRTHSTRATSCRTTRRQNSTLACGCHEEGAIALNAADASGETHIACFLVSSNYRLLTRPTPCLVISARMSTTKRGDITTAPIAIRDQYNSRRRAQTTEGRP